MPTIRIMTFNVENLLTRFSFRDFEKERLATLLDIDSEIDRADLIRTHWNAINDENRVFTGLTINKADPQVICLQEIDNMHALKAFNTRYLRRLFSEKRDPFTHKMLIEANDPRGIDVAVISKFKIENAKTNQMRRGTIHFPDKDKEDTIFRRDCLEIDIKKNNKILPVFCVSFQIHEWRTKGNSSHTGSRIKRS